MPVGVTVRSATRKAESGLAARPSVSTAMTDVAGYSPTPRLPRRGATSPDYADVGANEQTRADVSRDAPRSDAARPPHQVTHIPKTMYEFLRHRDVGKDRHLFRTFGTRGSTTDVGTFLS